MLVVKQGLKIRSCKTHSAFSLIGTELKSETVGQEHGTGTRARSLSVSSSLAALAGGGVCSRSLTTGREAAALPVLGLGSESAG